MANHMGGELHRCEYLCKLSGGGDLGEDVSTETTSGSVCHNKNNHNE